MSRVLLLSTYELGTEPLGLIGAATRLAGAGHNVRCCDLAVSPWPSAEVDWAERVAFSVPMHTALRLAVVAAERLRSTRPDLPIAYYGMYGPVAEAAVSLHESDLAIDGSNLSQLIEWVGGTTAADASDAGPVLGRTAVADEGPAAFGLPGLESYARLVVGDIDRFVGTVESTTGCNHRCRHCPVPTVYNGRSRAFDEREILAAIDHHVESGASHIHFADPDFLNRPQHAMRVARALHSRYPEVTFDATIKVSHVLRHRALFPELGASGLLFCVSAVESMSPVVLERLDKGHGPGEAVEAVSILRRSGIEVRPSLLPFTPWTTRDDLIDIIDFVASCDLIANVDPVHYSIRLLIPPRSLLLAIDDPVLKAALGPYDSKELGYPWTAVDSVLDELQLALARLTERAALDSTSFADTYRAVRSHIFAAFDRVDPGAPGIVTERGPEPRLRPHLSESWFCCAEPTKDQMARLTVTAQPEGSALSAPVNFLGRSH